MAVQCCWADVWIQTIQPKILLNVSISLPQNKRLKRSTDLRCIWERSCDHELCTACIGIALFLSMYWCVCVFFCIIFIIIENDCNEYIDRNHCVYTIRLKQSWLSVVRIKFLFVCYFIFTGAWYTAHHLYSNVRVYVLFTKFFDCDQNARSATHTI